MAWFCLADVIDKLGNWGNLIIPLLWFGPSAIVLLFRKPPLLQRHVLSQKLLVGLQLFRAIGLIFLLEMPDHVPTVFAYPAGLGDIATAIVAGIILYMYRGPSNKIKGFAVYFLVAFGMLDFVSTFFFGFTSSESPIQLFYPDPVSQLINFPTGSMVPLFLVPYAILFHTMSLLTNILHGNEGQQPETKRTSLKQADDDGNAVQNSTTEEVSPSNF
jgi:hypothetical protein